jgi:two-component system, cell cycle sensor histidine kinase and response regulator CckA
MALERRAARHLPEGSEPPLDAAELSAPGEELAVTDWPGWYRPYIATVSILVLLLSLAAVVDSNGRAGPTVGAIGIVALPVLTTAAFAYSIWGRRPRVMLAAALLFDAEGLLTSAAFIVGLAYAVLFPMVGLVLVLGVTRGRLLTIALMSAAVSCAVGVALALLTGPPSHLPAINSPWIPICVVSTFVVYAMVHLKLISDRNVEAMRLAESELASRRSAEVELERTSSLLSAIVDSSPVPTGAWLADGTVLLWNPASERMFGWTAGEVVGSPMPEAFTPPGEREPSAEQWRRLMGGDVLRGERVACGTKDGREVGVEVWASSLAGPDGAPMGVAGQLVDVTDRLAIEAQLRQAAKMEAIGRLSGGVAHDFNNMLTAIRGYVELARSGLDHDPVAARADLDEALRSAERASDLTRQLLTFSRRAIVEPRVIDPTDVVTRFAPMLRRLMGEHVTLRLDLDPAARSRVRADPSQLEQVILNLAVNAQEAMPNGGTLVIETRDVDLDEAWATGRPGARPGSFVRLAVTDTGTGMDRDTLGRAFEPFFTTKPQGRGTGMGLATVLGITAMSEGFVIVTSDAGAGTRFEIYLPRLVDVTEAASPAAVKGGPAARGSETILLLEDDDAVRIVAERTLSGLGYHVLVAGDGPAAIDLVEASDREIALVLSDIVLPGMQGPDAVRRMLALRPDLRVVFCSGFPASAPVEGDRLAGFPYLAKPYTAASLGAIVRSALDAHD